MRSGGVSPGGPYHPKVVVRIVLVPAIPDTGEVMRTRHISLPAALLLASCSYSSIEDGASYNHVSTVEDMFTSSFVLETDEGVVLFDAGYRASNLESALNERALSLDMVTDVFLTHGHGDHVAGLELFPSARIRALEDEIDLVAEESGASVTDPLRHGDIVTLGAFSVEVFSVPGHTAGNAAYLVDRVLLLGDSAFANQDGELIPTPDSYSDSPELLDASVRSLAADLAERDEQIDWVVPSHTGPLEGTTAFFSF
jgi:glyoxylase-like metal-dependent hydrolase (beta-lactamase superfamily II)